MTAGRGISGCLADERGVALVMSMLALMILSVLVIGFSVLSSTEPTIASNQLQATQSRALAEAGLEQAIWALSAGKVAYAGGTAKPAGAIDYQQILALAFLPPATYPPGYDGSPSSVSVAGNAIGTFGLTVRQPVANDPHQVSVQSLGCLNPSGDPCDLQREPHQRITAVAMDFPCVTCMPCAVCVRGDIQIGGTSTIDSRADTTCGRKYGTWSTTVKDSSGTTISPGNTTLGSGSPKVYGAMDSNNTPNQATDMAVRQSQADFDKTAMTNSSLDQLKQYAKSKGTYYQGAVTFSSASGRLLPDCSPNTCVVFVDTVSGNDIIPGTTPTSDYASVTVSGAASVNPTGFKGWLVVNGGLSISGSFTMQGLIYAVNDISYVGTGGQIKGQMISANVKDTIATVIDTSLSGAASLLYNCAATAPPTDLPFASGAGGFIVKAGTYKEVSD